MAPQLHYEIHRTGRYVRVIYMAQPKFPDWAESMEEILADPDYEPGFGFLLDRSRVPRGASSEYIHSMVDFIESHDPPKWALLVVDTSSHEMARMAVRLCISGRIRVFHDRDAARSWLSEA